MTTPYVSNATLEQIAQRLRAAGAVAILTHSKPDGDALGSTLALARTLHALGKQATLLSVPRLFAELPRAPYGVRPIPFVPDARLTAPLRR